MAETLIPPPPPGFEVAPQIGVQSEGDTPLPPAGFEVVSTGAPRKATQLYEALQAGYQASSAGLIIRHRLPDLVVDPESSTWIQRLASQVSGLSGDLPAMAVGGAIGTSAGGSVGAAAGSVVPGIGTEAGGVGGALLGGGAGAFAAPALIRQTLVETYKKGEAATPGQFLTLLGKVMRDPEALTRIGAETGTAAVVGAVTAGAGGVAARTIGKAVAPGVGQWITAKGAAKLITTSEVGAQIGAMVTVPAVAQGHLPGLEEFADAALVIGALHGAQIGTRKVMGVFSKTGKQPSQVAADANTDPTLARDLSHPDPEGIATAEQQVKFATGRMAELAAAEKMGTLTPDQETELSFLKQNSGNPEKLAAAYGVPLAERAEAPPAPGEGIPPPGPETPAAAAAPEVPRETTPVFGQFRAPIEPTMPGPISTRVADQLVATGRVDPAEAQTNGLLVQSFFETMGARTGRDPVELFDRYLKEVTGREESGQQELQFEQRAVPGSEVLGILNSGAKMEAPTGPRTSQDEARFLSAFPKGTRYPAATRLLARVRKASDVAADQLGGSPETLRKHAGALGPFKGYEVRADVLPGDSFNPDGRLEVKVYGKEQIKAGAIDEPALTFTVAPDGELSVNGPMPSGQTFAEFKAKGWAARATGADKIEQPGWSALRDPENPGKPLPISQLIPLLADVHARVRAWKGADQVGLYWSRNTGALGGLFGENPTAVFFQRAEAPTFYSALSRSIDQVSAKAAPAEGWKAQLKGMISKGQIKQAEIDATGLNDWLDMQKGKVTKEQVQEFLKGNGVQVQEVTLGGRTVSQDLRDAVKAITGRIPNDAAEWLFASEKMDSWAQRSLREGDRAQAGHYFMLAEEANRVAEQLETDSGAVANATKFSSYQLPGGENYRELLLTLPDKAEAARQDRNSRFLTLKEEVSTRLQKDIGNLYDARDQGLLTKDEEQTLARIDADAKSAPESESFTSSHFDEPNVLAHVRFNERTDAEGKRVLFLEELQSDWAQKGRKEGFAEPTKVERVESYPWSGIAQQDLGVKAGDPAWIVTNAQGRKIGTFLSEEKAKEAANEYESQHNGVPSAPFVGKTEAWTALALKRMIRYAAENGFDRVAWTTGEQQAARYDLSKQIDSLVYANEGGGTYSLVAMRDGREVVKRDALTESQLEDVVGKEIAKKIAEGEGKNIPGGPEKELTGMDLKVGGEGMKGYYDKIVPSVANDVLKKLGGGKVGDVWVNVPEKFGITPEGKTGNIKGVDIQPGFDITPELRDKVMAGQPLFQQGEGPARGYLDVPLSKQMTIGLLQSANKSTFLHEAGHLFLEVANDLAKAPDAPARLKTDMNEVFQWFGVKDAEAWNKLSLEEQRPYHEQFARGFEQYLMEGKAPTPRLATIFDQVKSWLLSIYKSADKLNVDLTPAVRQVMDRMLATEEEIRQGTPRRYANDAVNSWLNEAVRIVPGKEAEAVAADPYREIPQAPGEPSLPTHVNYNYWDSPEKVKMILSAVSQEYEARIQTQRRGTVSWAETSQEAAKLIADNLGKADSRLIAGRDPGTPAGAAELMARKWMLNQAAKMVQEAVERMNALGENATPQDKVQYLATLERSAMIQAEFLGARAEAGRALNILKSTAMGAERARQLNKVIEMYGADPVKMAEKMKEIDSASGLLKAAKEAQQVSNWDKFIEAWKAGILSGPVTHMANIVGNTTFAFMRPVVDEAAFLMGVLRHAKPEDRVVAMEPLARMTGLVQGMLDGIKIARKTFMSEFRGSPDADMFMDKAEVYRHAIVGKPGGTSAWDKVQNAVGPYVRIPFSALSAADAAFKTMNERGEAYSIAVRKAVLDGVDPRTREFRESLERFVRDPDPASAEQIKAAGLRFTFNEELGEKGKAVQSLVRKAHLEFFVPFIRTPLNIAVETLRMTPFAPALERWRGDFAAGGVARDRAMAEIALGTALSATVIAFTLQGNVTGEGSPDPGKRRAAMAAGWQPYSIKINGKWYAYNRVQPVGTLMGMAANVAEVWDYMTEEESDKIPKMLATAFGDAITSQTFLQGITNVVEALSDPTRFVPTMAKQSAGSLVPNIIGQPTGLLDDQARYTDSMLDAIKSRIPGMREKLYPKIDVWGQPIPGREYLGGILPSSVSEISTDPVRLEAARLGVNAPSAPKKVHVGRGTGKLGDVELTPEQRDVFLRVAGDTTYQIMSPLVGSEAWAHTPDLIKQRAFQRAFAVGHRVAALSALPPELRQGVIDQISEKMNVLLSDPTQAMEAVE
jgi:hypothetical protein